MNLSEFYSYNRLISIFDRGETRLLRSTISRSLVVDRCDHVDGASLALLGRRVRRGGGVALLGAVQLGPDLGILLDRLELAELVEAFLGNLCHGHRDRCVRRRQPRSPFVTPTKTSITNFVLSSLGLELLATRRGKFNDKLLVIVIV